MQKFYLEWRRIGLALVLVSVLGLLTGCQPLTPAPLNLASTESAVTFGEVDPRAAAVRALVEAGDYQGAIDKAIEVYGIDVSKAPSVTYDPNYVEAYAKTDPATGAIIVGPSSLLSPAWLASTIGHEAIHANQIADGRSYIGVDGNGKLYVIDQQGVILQDYEAWKWEFDHADENGLSAEEKEELEYGMGFYYGALSEANRELADKGIYTLPGVEPYKRP